MPLDGHSYLISQGWSGKGNGLRKGAISRPLAIPQKKNLAGLGKDRDEAFPFWDHLFSAAAKSIQIKVSSDSEDSDSDDAGPSSAVVLKRTTTGIFSNRRPIEGTPATSGISTPDIDIACIPRLNLLATAKREAAKKRLYASFFRGPVLGPDDGSQQAEVTVSSTTVEVVEIVPADTTVPIPLEGNQKKQKKDESLEDKEARRERKRRKREVKEATKLEDKVAKKRRKEEKRADKDETRKRKAEKEEKRAKRRREGRVQPGEEGLRAKKKRSADTPDDDFHEKKKSKRKLQPKS